MLTTERLIIRPVRAADADAMHEVRELNWRVVGSRPRTRDEVREMIAEMEAKTPSAQPGWYQYAVVLRSSGDVIGDVAVNFGGPDERQAELGYGLLPARWGNGYGPEAVGRVLTWLFRDHGLHRVVAITQVENARCRALLARLGFRLEAQTVESFFHHGKERFIDEVGYAILAREWRGAA